MVIKLLSQLNDAEIKRFKKFIESLYFNSNNNATKLFTVLKKYHPKFNPSKIIAEQIYGQVFPNHGDYQFNTANFRSLCAHLANCIQEFLIIEELNTQKTQKDLLLLDAYTKKEIAPEINNRLVKKLLQPNQSINSKNFLYQYLLYEKLYEKELLNSSKLKESYFSKLNQQLDFYFSLTKIKYGIEHHNLLQRGLKPLPIDFIKEIKTFIEINGDKLPKALELYAKLYDFSINENLNNKQFQSLYDLFEAAIPQLEKDEAIEIFTTLSNFCNREITKRNHPDLYRNWRFKLIKLAVPYNLFLQKNIFLKINL